MSMYLIPGAVVRHPAHADWGRGQVQSAIGNKITVNFENAGKVVINSDIIELVVAEGDSKKQ